MAETRALLVMHQGKLIAELYGDGYDADTRFISWSMAKSFTGVLIGFLVARSRPGVAEKRRPARRNHAAAIAPDVVRSRPHRNRRRRRQDRF